MTRQLAEGELSPADRIAIEISALRLILTHTLFAMDRLHPGVRAQIKEELLSAFDAQKEKPNDVADVFRGNVAEFFATSTTSPPTDPKA